ncbi:MAG: type IV toxin-antitoxin system AbiEi family antitoxin domain-containing protein [Gemmatimonadota bacterium]
MKYVGELLWRSVIPRSPVFTTGELADAAEIQLSNASRDLSTLAKRGLIIRIRRGLWADTRHPDFSPYAVVPFLFGKEDEGYVSLLSALSLHGMIEQIPRTIQVVSKKQRASLKTPVGAYEFHRLKPNLFGGAEPYGQLGTFDIARPAKALFDILYLSTRRNRRFEYLPEVELAKNFSEKEMQSWINKVDHAPLRTAIENRWRDLKLRLKSQLL